MKYIKKYIKIIFCALVASSMTLLAGCASHSKNGANAAGAGGIGGPGGENGAYAQGLGGDEGDFQASQSCSPMRPIPGTAQRYFFAFDKADIQPEGMVSLRRQANYLIGHPNAKVVLQGNTDERGSREYNIGLGWRRAKAVAAALNQLGVPNRQINTMSFGAEKPIADGHDERAFSCNRNVYLKYSSK